MGLWDRWDLGLKDPRYFLRFVLSIPGPGRAGLLGPVLAAGPGAGFPGPVPAAGPGAGSLAAGPAILTFWHSNIPAFRHSGILAFWHSSIPAF